MARDSVVTLPRGADHATDFGKTTTTIVVVRDCAGNRSDALAPIVRRQRHVRAAATSSLGWRLAGELRARDAGWALAAEGLVLQLLATAARADTAVSTPRGGWLRQARDLLHVEVPLLDQEGEHDRRRVVTVLLTRAGRAGSDS